MLYLWSHLFIQQVFMDLLLCTGTMMGTGKLSNTRWIHCCRSAEMTTIWIVIMDATETESKIEIAKDECTSLCQLDTSRVI